MNDNSLARKCSPKEKKVDRDARRSSRLYLIAGFRNGFVSMIQNCDHS